MYATSTRTQTSLATRLGLPNMKENNWKYLKYINFTDDAPKCDKSQYDRFLNGAVVTFKQANDPILQMMHTFKLLHNTVASMYNSKT